jgi:hypothetical protein
MSRIWVIAWMMLLLEVLRRNVLLKKRLLVWRMLERRRRGAAQVSCKTLLGQWPVMLRYHK